MEFNIPPFKQGDEVTCIDIEPHKEFVWNGEDLLIELNENYIIRTIEFNHRLKIFVIRLVHPINKGGDDKELRFQAKHFKLKNQTSCQK